MNATQNSNILNANSANAQQVNMQSLIERLEQECLALRQRANNAEAACVKAVDLIEGGERQALSRAVAVLRSVTPEVE